MAAVLCSMMLLVGAARAEPSYDFRPPATVNDPAAGAIMRDLAARIIPVYREAEPNRYLENLSALQLTAGNIDAAHVSRQTLRDRRRSVASSGAVSRDVIYDMYVNARALEANEHIPFAQAFAKSYRDVSSRLNDRNQFIVIHWLQTPPETQQSSLQASFDRQRAQDSIGEAAAVEMIWQYFVTEAYRSFGALVDLLGAEDDRRRYTTDGEVSIEGADGGDLSALVVRPRGAGPLPALLEFTIDQAPSNFAKECAAHGYVGVVAWSGAAEGAVPYQHEGEDVRSVLAWIAEQPWSDGRVGLYGTGYSAFAAWAAAKHPSPALKAIATSSAIVPGIDSPMAGGIFHNSAYHWSLEVTDGVTEDDASVFDETRWRALDQKWYASGARYRDLGRILGHPNPLFGRWLNHPSYDGFWRRLIPNGEEFAHIGVPVLTMTGLYGMNEPGDLYYFTQHRRYAPRSDHRLLIGPYDDGAVQRVPSASVRGLRIDEAAVVDLRELRYEWFDHVFKDGALPSLLKSNVNYEVPGQNEWRHAASVDAMSGSSLRFYLDGSMLSRKRPSTDTAEHAVRRTVNFADRSDADLAPPVSLSGRELAQSKSDALFVSEPIPEAVELAGIPSGALEFTANKLDMDLRLMLYELQPNGLYVRLFSPVYEFRASYAHDRAHRRLLKAGVRQTLPFKSERMVIRQIKAGSRLVMILGINKRPDREINYGTGGDVSEESIADATVPLRVRWHAGSFIDIPIRKSPER